MATAWGAMNKETPGPEGTAALSYQYTHDYTKQNAGLGFSYRFGSPKDGLWVDEYHYRANRPSWSNGIKNEAIEQHFKDNIAEARAAAKAGYYKSVEVLQQDSVTIEGVELLHCRLRTVTKQGDTLQSHIYLTALDGELAKFRVSWFEAEKELAQSSVNAFLKTRLKALKK